MGEDASDYFLPGAVNPWNLVSHRHKVFTYNVIALLCFVSFQQIRHNCGRRSRKSFIVYWEPGGQGRKGGKGGGRRNRRIRRGKKSYKFLQLYVMSYDASRGKSHAITNGDVSFCCRPLVRSVREKHPHNFGSYQTFVQRWRWKHWLRSSLVTSPLCLQLSIVMHVSLPGQESYHTVNYQIIAGVFIWGKNLGWKCHKLRQLLCEFSGIFLQVKLLQRRKRFS